MKSKKQYTWHLMYRGRDYLIIFALVVWSLVLGILFGAFVFKPMMQLLN